MSSISESEIQFLKVLNSHHLRIDGRKYFQSRPFLLENNMYQTCFSSINISNNDSKIILTLKGEVVETDNFEIKMSFEPKPKDDKEINEVLDLVYKLMLNSLNHQCLFPSIKEYSWKFYIDVFSTDSINISMFQLICEGIKSLLKGAKIPKIIKTINQFNTTEKEYNIVGSQFNKESILSESDQVHDIDISQLNDVYFFGLENMFNNLFLDPSEKELAIIDSYVLLSINSLNEITNLQAVKGNIDLKKIEEINKFVLSIKQ